MVIAYYATTFSIFAFLKNGDKTFIEYKTRMIKMLIFKNWRIYPDVVSERMSVTAETHTDKQLGSRWTKLLCRV